MSQEADYSNAPTSPRHPDADQEVNGLPEESISQSELDLLDLNPDLEAGNGPTSEIPNSQSAGRVKLENDANVAAVEELGDRIEDFQPVIVPSPLNANEQSNDTTPKRRLSLSQQSKFINYVDERLLAIQRRFVQALGLSELGYKSINELIADLKQLISFIWFSIDNDSNTHLTKDQFKELPSTNFGQTDYLIRIAGDLLEYIDKLAFEEDSGVKILKLIDEVDQKISRLIDGRIPGGKGLTGTDIVRIQGIAERARLAIIEAFEKKKIEGYRYELTKVYERVLDRVI
ncbi:hypothetical protein BN7_3630 [Wickerhamomyces ciferrii]|uniref:Uncharacterized protein n=1 Tax=Wickerhamomyces ciferrii (strain ATCC 14091 / BCRC 22168 / CBS 111 / JCM 3599 / NBRC 0793 / NRRL Y-1031 F-60-10) TaxID=1206466 RepID=K0KM44_WICCF|nr:uncharacterized protein BN7_3630 [Wickerhamomyces ciferrii]CCH44071.1 hypothetical protein BN7_3630 [Wickerhamomyces ciferrii]